MKVCDPIHLSCTCDETGSSVVKEYQVEVKHAKISVDQ
jgi:hypothetical protein